MAKTAEETTATQDASSTRPRISIAKEQIINRQGRDFVLYAGLLDAAHKAGLQAIGTNLLESPSAANGQTAIVHAEVIFPWGHFSGIGDANAGNVGRMIAPHIIRMAETRAKARALRDALNIGMAALEELGPDPDEEPARPTSGSGGGSSATRRPIQAQAQTAAGGEPDFTMTVGDNATQAGSTDEEWSKFTRLAATATRLGIDVPKVAPDSEVAYVVEQRNKLLRQVNEALAKRRASN